jgi:hypothetical protein
MFDVLAIASRNLLRYRRRTSLTLLLIVIGMLAVLLFVAVAGSFKAMMIGQITDSLLGHVQVHRKGYVAAIDSLPLNLNMRPNMLARVEEALNGNPAIEAWSPRIKFGGMYSNFAATTSIRINGIDPAREAAAVPLLPGRVIEGDKAGPLLARGQILIPQLLARGFKLLVAFFVWFLPLIVISIPIFIGAALAGGQNGNSEAAAAFGALFIVCASCLMVLWGLFVLLISPAIYIRLAVTDRLGAAFEISRLWALTRDNLGNVIIAILLTIVAGIVAGIAGSLGFILLLIGALVTIPAATLWQYLVQAHLFGQGQTPQERRT